MQVSKSQSLSLVQLFATPQAVARQPSPSMEFSRQEYLASLLHPWNFPGKNTWSGLPFPSGDLPDPRIEPKCPALQVDSLYRLSHQGSLLITWASLVAQRIKHLPAVQKTGFDPWVRKIPGDANGNPLQYSCLENSTDGGTW